MERRRDFRPRAWVALLGVLGLMGLLLAGRAWPGAGQLLAAGAFAWFLGLGAYETVWRGSRRRI